MSIFDGALGLGQSAHECLHRIEDLLDQILQAVKNDEIHETVRPMRRRLVAASTVLGTVPQGETWELAIASVDPDVAGSFRLLANGTLRLAFALAVEGSSLANAVTLFEGEELTAELVTAATADMFLQFNVKTTRPIQAIP